MPDLTFETTTGALDISIDHLIVAGWTGRDAAKVQHHIDELAEIGVQPPSQVPLYYRVGAGLLTQAPQISVVGPDTSGEAEPFVVSDATGRLWLGLASDHTDRALETASVAKSKQVCPKPVAPMLWPFDQLAPHLDELTLTSEIKENGSDSWTLYQSGALTAIRPLPALMRGLPEEKLSAGSAMLCGTIPATGGIRPAHTFRMSLADPVLGRTITHSYHVTELPVIA